MVLNMTLLDEAVPAELASSSVPDTVLVETYDSENEDFGPGMTANRHGNCCTFNFPSSSVAQKDCRRSQIFHT